MRISYNWLKQYVETDLSPQQAGDILTSTGLEVESVELFEAVKGMLAGVVVGHVLQCDPRFRSCVEPPTWLWDKRCSWPPWAAR